MTPDDFCLADDQDERPAARISSITEQVRALSEELGGETADTLSDIADELASIAAFMVAPAEEDKDLLEIVEDFQSENATLRAQSDLLLSLGKAEHSDVLISLAESVARLISPLSSSYKEDLDDVA